MERLVNGYYDDPKSTRDLIGITPKEFEFIISLLQEKHVCAQTFFGLDENEKRKAVFPILEIFDGAEENSLNTSNITYEEALGYFEQNMVNSYQISYKILQDINQPYPGATYNPPA